jgi:predicted ester cyclase
MSIVDTVYDLLGAIEANDFDEARSYLADGFTLDGPVPEPIGADQWLGLHQIMNAAMPDFSFNAGEATQNGNVVMVSLQISGTQENTLDLSPMGLPKVAPTGIFVELPEEQSHVTFSGDKVIHIHVEPVSGGGLMGLLGQLGVQLPPH